MSNNYSLYELLNKNKDKMLNINGQLDVSAVVKLLAKNNYCALPCKVGDTVYKFCPEEQVKNCDLLGKVHCDTCNPDGCVYGLFRANDFNTVPVLNIVPFKVTDDNIFNVIKYWGVLYFDTKDLALTVKAHFYGELEGETADERYANYCKWVEAHKFRFSEAAKATTPDEDFDVLIKEGIDGIEYRLENEPSFADATEMYLTEGDFKVYCHIPSGRYFCLDIREPYTFGRAVEVELMRSVLVTGREGSPELLEDIRPMLFAPYYCGGYSHSKEATRILWFREKSLKGGDDNA